jgi:glycosyltransferase involved in cell wall biosynthesis
MCAGLIPNEYEIKRKGFDILVEAAKRLTDTKFVLIGFIESMKEQFEKLNLKNLELYGTISYDELINHYSRAKVFAQISMFEGLPSTLCEAMLCECIPVGSGVNAIPKIINGKGFIIKKKDLDEIVSVLEKAVNAPQEMGREARQHIIDNFPLVKRENELTKIIEEISG